MTSSTSVKTEKNLERPFGGGPKSSLRIFPPSSFDLKINYRFDVLNRYSCIYC